MIRLNPTSIRLRPADVKALQDELERQREAAKVQAQAGVQASGKPTTSGGTHGRRKDRDREHNASSRSRASRTNHNNTNQNAPVAAADQAVEERRRRRAAMTAQERIGYIS
ncbi:hypothetical protein CcaverHIS631_0408470 [Cutaneotrichosporon cavernicola]|nr:hypothetical protein CcaverHIS631_0408470 [Cutaneotrichosporon cavernicola]